MKRLLALTLISSSLFGWSFFFTDDDSPPTKARPVTFTVMIDPAGDAKDPGRVIDDTYERSLTMQLAEELKSILEKNNRGLKVIFTRRPGEALEALQNVSFSNRLSVNLYIRLSFFEQPSGKPSLYIYSLIYDPAIDFIQKSASDLALLSYDQAYKVSLSHTKEYAQKLSEACNPKKFTCYGHLAIPYKPLIGIMAPSIGIEIGITRKNQWKQLVAPLATALQKSIYP